MADSNKVYIGDSVYAENDGYHIILTTDNGYGPSNRIALDPDVVAGLEVYAASLQRKREQAHKAQLKEQEENEG